MKAFRSRLVLAALVTAALSLVAFRDAQAQAPTNDACLECHDSRKAKIEVPTKDGVRPLGAIDLVKFASSVHAHLPCVDCHQDITDTKAQHERKPDAKRADCVQCHTDLWDKTKGEASSPRKERLEKVARNIDAYKVSFHARPSKDAPTRVNAVCPECHGSHDFNIPPATSPYHDAWRLAVPKSCGAACHEDQLEAYEGSVHGKAVLDKKDAKAAVCVDCHSSHRILSSTADPFKLAIIDNCGDCHKDARASYLTTYHGQVRNLGYTYTAKCYNCHGSHKILKVADPKSTVHPNNRLATCQTCHSDKKPGMRDATAGFVSFGPHAHASDFAKYPEVWLASRFMLALLFFVFLFFWAHSGLWYWREWQDRKSGKKTITRVDAAKLGIDPKKHVRRFGAGWRIAHLAFALVTMTLVLTGTSALFAETAWASVVAKLVGGPKVLGIIHRVAAALFVGLFMGHLFYVVYHLARVKNFRWFGPDSLIPNWKDLADCYGMFK